MGMQMTEFPKRVRFVDARRGQCFFFLPGETGMEGFVCGDATPGASKSYCACHRRLVFQPLTATSRIQSGYFDLSVRAAEIDDEELDLTELVS